MGGGTELMEVVFGEELKEELVVEYCKSKRISAGIF